MNTPRTTPTFPGRARGRGFTLIELVIATVIGMLVAGATMTSLNQLFRARATSASHQQAFARADGAAARIALDLASAVRTNEPVFQKVSVVNGGTPGAERDEVLILMHSLRPLRGIDVAPEGDEFEVQYRLMPGEGGASALWRRLDTAHDQAIDGGGIAGPIIGGLASMSIQASDGSDQWFEEWDSDTDGLPHAIRLVVTAQSDDGKAVARATRVVAIDRVPLPPPATDTATTDGSTDGATPSGSAAKKKTTTPTTPASSGYTSTAPASNPRPSGGNRGTTGGSGGTSGSGSGGARPPTDSGTTRGGG